MEKGVCFIQRNIKHRDMLHLYREDGYQHRSHNKNLLYVHLIFATKYRKPLLQRQLDTDMKQWIFETCQSHHWYMVRMESDKDHLHMLIQYNPTDSISRIAKILKQVTTHQVWQKYSQQLKNQYWKERTFWSDGYFAASVGNASKETIDQYIKNQG